MKHLVLKLKSIIALLFAYELILLVQESVIAEIIGVYVLLLYLAIQVAEKHFKVPEITSKK